MRFLLTEFENAASRMHPRFRRAILRHARRDGDHLVIDADRYTALAQKHGPKPQPRIRWPGRIRHSSFVIRHFHRRRLRGIGDLIHILAHPIARLLDRLFRTRLEHCKACAQRRANWNQKLPFP